MSVAPSPRDNALCEIFAEVLGVDTVNLDDNFFALGGHSLHATRVVGRVRSVLGLELSLRALFEAPTVGALARRLDETAGGARRDLAPVERPERIPLSSGQRGLWFIAQMPGTGDTYNVPVVLRMAGTIDLAALERALNDVVTRHESLRTVVRVSAGEPWQLVLSPIEAALSLRWTNVDAGDLPSRVARACRHRFDLASEPPIRADGFSTASDAHVLILLMHHIACDGWSLAPLARDLTSAYAARIAGATPQWADLPVQYADYAVWQRESLGSGEDSDSFLTHLIAFWRQNLHGMPDELALPADRPRPAVPSYRGAALDFVVPTHVFRQLSGLGVETGVTPFMTLQAALAATMALLGAGTDIPLGTAVAGRHDATLDDLVGFFVNTVVLRTDVAGNPTFRELLTRVREADLVAFQHQDLPFERLVEALNPTRIDGRHPLVQMMLVLQNNRQDVYDLPGLDVRREVRRTSGVKFDLAFTFHERFADNGEPAGLTGVVEYATDLFDQYTAQSLVRRLLRLLEVVAAEPDVPLDDVCLMSEPELDQVLRKWNDTRLELPPATLPDVLEAWVARTPHAVALVSGETRLTYRELDERANRLARYLVSRGVGPEQIVAIALPRGAAMVVALLAVLKAGAAYLPVDVSSPPARVAYMLADARPALLLCNASTRSQMPDGSFPWVDVDDGIVRARVAEHLDRPLHNAERLTPLVPAHPAYVIYTSGSTGNPKGVVVPHTGLSSLAWAHVSQLELDADTRVLQLASFSFDVSVTDIVVAFAAGGALVVAPTSMTTGAELSRLMAEHAITYLETSPTVLATVPPRPLPDLRTLNVGSEAFSGNLIRSWSTGRSMVNTYGLTETSSTVTISGPLADEDVPPIGRPIANTRLFVLDGRLRPVPAGVTGEIYVAGASLARGYLGRAELTAHRFVACPFGEPGERMYRTGDLARWRQDDHLYLVGRADDQVKVRGHRIELGGIESVLARHPLVARASVVVREDRPGDQRLVAYVVPPAGADPQPAAIRAHLAAVLPDYVVPDAVVLLKELPLTVNGKLDRRRLPAPDYGAASRRRAPSSHLETVLCEAFAEALGVEAVGVNDGFFDLGGHSLLATRLMWLIGERLGVVPPLNVIFAGDTVAKLAVLVDPEGDRGAEGVAAAPDDFVDDVALDPAIVAETTAQHAWATKNPERVLLTGATGFLGAFLLREVLDRTDAEAYCLVRAADAAEARDRLERNLEGYGLWEDRLRDRIVAVPGDLALPRLGLTQARYDQLARQVQVVYHNGARVNHLEPYGRLKDANVAGTREICRLAVEHHTKPVHYVSTISTVVAGAADPEILPEDWFSEPELLGANGYVRSKWVAEGIIRIAARRGIPTAIYRPSRISGHSRTGAMATDDAFWHHVKACIDLAARPVPEGEEVGRRADLVPVDFVSAAFLHLARTRSPDGAVYNLVPTDQIEVEAVLDHAHSLGHRMESVPRAEWQRRLQAATTESSSLHNRSLHAALLLRSADRRAAGRFPRDFARHNLLSGLAGSSISCPPIGRELLNTYFTYFTESGFLRAPRGGHTP